MKNLKRDNWTNEEVMKILDGLKVGRIVDDKFVEDEGIPFSYNDALEYAKQQFYDFVRPTTEMGAMAYCPEEDMIYHVGKEPPR